MGAPFDGDGNHGAAQVLPHLKWQHQNVKLRGEGEVQVDLSRSQERRDPLPRQMPRGPSLHHGAHGGLQGPNRKPKSQPRLMLTAAPEVGAQPRRPGPDPPLAVAVAFPGGLGEGQLRKHVGHVVALKS
ncbi:hypothetical protein E2320_006582 [Naja naja]|nr:hypothetical protein E2320_006582 [Naja naja]